MLNKLKIPIVKRAYPSLIASKLVGVQPMTRPTGLLHYIRFRYCNDKPASSDIQEAIRGWFVSEFPEFEIKDMVKDIKLGFTMHFVYSDGTGRGAICYCLDDKFQFVGVSFEYADPEFFDKIRLEVKSYFQKEAENGTSMGPGLSI